MRRIDPRTAAEVAAESYASYDDMAHEASYSGWDESRFAYLYRVTLTAPGTGELLQMLRRGKINEGNFAHGLRKAKLEPMWDDALLDLQHVRLTPQQLALGIVRSVVPDPGLLAATLDLSGGVVPAYPEWQGDVLAESLAGGIDKDRLRVMVGEIGLPMSAQQAASAYFRKIIHLGDYNRAILEGDTRPEWAPYILDQSRAILSPGQYTELELRGFYDRAVRLTNTDKWGMSHEDSDALFNVQGRSIPVHQITTGLARGGIFDGPHDAIPPAYLQSLQRGNLRPEYYNLAYANRYSYPSPFVLRALTQAGDISGAQAHDILLAIGWVPSLATQVAARWASGAAGGGKEQTKAELIDEYEGGFLTESELRDHLTALGWSGAALDLEVHLADARRIKGWRDKGITALGKRYVATTMDEAAADTYLQELQVVDPDTRARIIGVWNIEREFK